MAGEIEALAGCAIAVTTALRSARAADADAAIERLRAMPAHLPGRGHFAACLIGVLVNTGIQNPGGMRHLDLLLAIAESDTPAIADWPRLRAGGRCLAILHTAAQGKAVDVDAALAEMENFAALAGDDPRLGPLFATAQASLGLLRSINEGNPAAAAHRLQGQLAGLAPLAPPDSELGGLQAVLVEAAGALKAAHQDPGGIGQAMQQLQRAADQLPPGHFVRDAMAQAQTQMGVLQGYRPGDKNGSEPAWQAPTAQQWQALAEMASRPGTGAADRAMSHLALGGAELGMGHETDPAKIEAGIAHFRAAITATDPSEPVHAFALQSLALALSRRAEVAGGTAGLDEALALLGRARPLLGGAHHPQWTYLAELESAIQRRLGRPAEARRSAFEGQRAHSWQALLQPDTATARIAIRDTAADALDLARRCLADGDPAAALHALDAGRGLMLFAATQVRGIARRLREGGHAELADRWQAAADDAGAVSEDLRRKVLAVLAQEQESFGSLLDPPSFAEIQAALTAIKADALVYLVPAAAPIPGWAVIAPAAGPPSCIALPELAIDADVERYLAALAAGSRDAEAAADPVAGDDPRELRPAARRSFADSLERLCDWAWRAAMGPLLERYLQLPAAPAQGPVRRVVLVPVGDLARIPWQAARHRNGTYAVQVAAFTQAVSARLLCDNASRPPIQLGGVGLIVGDPDTSGRAQPLAAARREAYAIRQAFYPGARYIGRRHDGSPSPSGAGTAQEVRDWLASPALSAGAVLHLACHGSVRTAEAEPTAYLLLAGQAEAEPADLHAEELVRVMGAATARDLALVVLAACNTGRSVHGYDEAYSLGTAFLAGRTRSVLSTQWSVPDVATSVLMFMFHHYLRHEAMPPWAALRHAQLWMLDPHREPPEHMPGYLRRHTGGDDDHAKVAAWAGFVHWGQ